MVFTTLRVEPVLQLHMLRGAAALLLQKNPELENHEIKSLLLTYSSSQFLMHMDKNFHFMNQVQED